MLTHFLKFIFWHVNPGKRQSKHFCIFYCFRIKFTDYLHKVVIPDIQLWNPRAGPTLTLDQYLCAGIELLMETPHEYYKVLRSTRLGRKGVYISRQSFPHIQGTKITDFDEYVRRLGGKTNASQKFLRADSIDMHIVVTASDPGLNKWPI